MAAHLFHGRTVVIAVAVSAAISAGAASAGTSYINGHLLKAHTVDAKALTPAAVKYLRGLRGPAGPAGPIGPMGAAGQTGPTGAMGPTGAAGTNGTNGFAVADHAAISGAFNESTGTANNPAAVPLTSNTWTQAANETDFGPMGNISYTVGAASGTGSVAWCNGLVTQPDSSGNYPANSTVTLSAYVNAGLVTNLDTANNTYGYIYLDSSPGTHTDVINNTSVIARPAAATGHTITAQTWAECETTTAQTDSSGNPRYDTYSSNQLAMPLSITAVQMDTMAGIGK